MASLPQYFILSISIIILSTTVTKSNSQANIIPPLHGINNENNPGKASPSMVAFFSKANTELPEAQNISDQMLKSASKVAPADPGRTQGHARPALLVTGIVFAILGVGLLVTAAVAYLIHARRVKAQSNSDSFVGLSHWNEL